MSRAIPESTLAAASVMGVPLDAEQVRRMTQYLERLFEVNEAMNLTAIRDWDTACTRHLLDSLTLATPLRSVGARRVVDVGAGGGLPGIPLAIAMPELELTMIESIKKKAAFLGRIAAELDLAATVLEERAEVLAAVGSAHREAYDACVVRALAPLPVLLELTVPFVRVGGRVLAIKGEKAEAEIAASSRALQILGARVIDRQRTATGTVVTLEKKSPTPAAYPRTPGIPKRQPL